MGQTADTRAISSCQEVANMKPFVRLTTLAFLTFFFVMANAGAQESKSPQAPPDQQHAPSADQQQAAQPAHASNDSAATDDKGVRKSILTDLNKSHDTAHRVNVKVTHDEVLLTGTLWTQQAKDEAEKMATEHAAGRKVTNKISVRPPHRPNPGL
jgi:osmotically-inducible protein OsmY